MSDSIANPQFFKAEKAPVSSGTMSATPKLESLFSESIALLSEENLDSFSSEIEATRDDLKRQTFTVAVVGEFSRGKSTFINNLFDREFLPVANMPTTAMLTRIKYSEKEYITVLDTANRKKKILPLSVDSWDQYIASDDGKDPSGAAFVGLKSKWLASGIEIIDTPGAGDLESSRAAVIGDALRGCDGAIITISATAAMSMSERLFIEERLISKKTPFLMLIITKLDTISKEQRNGIIDFVKAKLETWNMKDIPVYVPYKTEMPDNKYESIIGMDKVKGQISSWISSSERNMLTEKWVAAKIASHLDSAVAFLNEKRCLFEAENDSKRQELADKKTQMLSQAVLVWEKAKSDMIQKCEECYKLFMRKAQEEQINIIEKLQYDVSHVTNLKKWWEEDYPYRLKLEMTRLASFLESVIGKQLATDVRNFNTVLEKNFKTGVLYSADEILSKEEYTDFKAGGSVAVKDINSERTIGRVGVAALSLGSVMLMMSAGIPPIIGSMGIGTGGSILSEVFFKKRTEEQREILKKQIEGNVPGVVKNAMIHSEKRIRKIYSDIISDSSSKQESWIKTQKDIIQSSTENASSEDIESINITIKKIEELSKKAQSFA